MKFRDYIFAICVLFFMIMAYLFFDRGFNLRTKNLVNYEEEGTLKYQVYLNKNDDYTDEYLKMNERYIASLVDKIKFEVKYSDIFSSQVNGFYTYYVRARMHAYLNDVSESIWERDYNILDNKTIVLDKNGIKDILIKDNFTIDYNYFRNEIDKFSKKYGLKLSGYLEVQFVVKEELNFASISSVSPTEKVLKANIPLTFDTFRIDIDNISKYIDNYHKFDKQTDINYILAALGGINLAFAISFMALIIKDIVLVLSKRNKYLLELRRILSEYDDIIVEVKRFYNRKKYNLIYVSSFKELMDVYRKVGNPISFREIKKHEEAMFVIIADDNAWIYQMRKKDI